MSRWRRAPRLLVPSLGQITRSDGYFSLNHKKFPFSSLLPHSSRGNLSLFLITSSLCKILCATEPCSNWSGCYNAARGQHSSQLGTSAQQPGPRVRGEQAVLAGGVHLSVVLTFALSLCYWRMSNVVGCLEVSNYQAICQNVGRHLNYNSFGRWHEELAY